MKWGRQSANIVLAGWVKDLCYQTNPIGDGFLNKHFQVVSLSYTVKAQIGSLQGEGASKCHNWGTLSRPTPFSALLPAASIWCRMVEVLAVGWKGRIYIQPGDHGSDDDPLACPLCPHTQSNSKQNKEYIQY